MASTPAERRKNQILYAQRQAEAANLRLRQLMSEASPEELDEFIAQQPQPPEPPDDPPVAEPPPDAEPEPEPPPAAARITGLPPEIVARIRAEAKAYVDKQVAERHRAAASDMEAQLKESLIYDMRRAAGLTSHLDDLVEHTVNCPPFADRYIRDGVEYHHGYTYTMTRAVYDSMREDESRGWDAEDRAGNPNRKFYRRPEMTQNPLLRQRYADDGHAISRETTFSAMGGPPIDAPVNNLLAGGIAAQGRVQ